jgi:hypothetical protein
MAERQIAVAINLLQYVGERSLTEARLSGSYQDRTGNQRNSIGYIIVMDGKIIRENGGDEGRKFARQMIREFPKGLVLVVAAGMKYASYVAAKGYNVIDSAEDLAERLVPQMLKDLGIK